MQSFLAFCASSWKSLFAGCCLTACCVGLYCSGGGGKGDCDDKDHNQAKCTATQTSTSTSTQTKTSAGSSTSTSTSVGSGYTFPSNPGLSCTIDKFQQPTNNANAVKKLDLLFVMDHSGSMDANWQRMSQNIQYLVKELPKDLDISYSVLLSDGAPAHSGKLYGANGVPVVLSNQKYSTSAIAGYLARDFSAAMQLTDSYAEGEASFLSLYHAVTVNALANQKLGFFRPDAALSVVFMSDEDEIGNPFPNPQAPGLPPRCDGVFEDSVKAKYYYPFGINYASTFKVVQALKGDMPVMTHAFVNINANDLFRYLPRSSKCTYENLGYGYFEMVDETKGVLFSIKDDQTQGMTQIGQVINDRLNLLHDFKLSTAANLVDPSTIVAVVDNAKVDETYNASTDSVHLVNAGGAGSMIQIQHCAPVVKPSWTLSGFTGQAGQHAVALSWQTPELATSTKVIYGTSASALTQAVSVAGTATNHVVTVSGLSANTLYYFQAVSDDAYGVEKTSAVASFRSLPDWTLSLDSPQVSRNVMSISWHTPEYATTGQVLYGLQPDALSSASAVTAASLDHSVTLSNLAAASTYYYQVVADDAYGQEQRSAVLSATTLSDWGIVGFAGVAGQTAVALSWQTPTYNTTDQVMYGTDPSALTSSATDGLSGESHALTVSGLQSNTVYYFQVVGSDNLGVSKASAVLSILTQADWSIVGFAGTPTTSSVTVSWQTPQFPTSGTVLWGSSAASLSSSVVDSAGSSESHSVVISGLAANTVYYFQAVGVDQYGLTKASPVTAISTQPNPVVDPTWSLSGFQGVASSTAITATWATSQYATTGTLLIGLSESALSSAGSEAAAVMNHQVIASGLSPDTTYYIQAVSTDDYGQSQSSAVIAVHTLPAASVTDTNTQTATVTSTNTGTSSATVTSTSSSTATATQTSTASASNTVTATSTAISSSTDSSSNTDTSSNTVTVTNTSTSTSTSTTVSNWTVQSFDATTTTNGMSVIWTTPGANTTAVLAIGFTADNLTAQTIDVSTYADTQLVTVTGLQANTNYYMQVTAMDANGRTQQSAVVLKKTKAQ